MEKRRAILLSAVLVFVLLVSGVFAEQLGIEIEKNNYVPGEQVKFRLIVYDDEFNRIAGNIKYEIQDFYTEIVDEGSSDSGEVVVFVLPEDAQLGHWGIIARHNDAEKKELFNVLQLEKIDISLENDELVINNLGNVPISAKQISISIGGNEETALVSLEKEQEKRIRLTAPAGEYDIRISDGTEENTFEVRGVSLTGNVIGIEKVGGNFWSEYSLVSLFLVVLVLVVIVVFGLKFLGKRGKTDIKNKRLKKSKR